MNRMNTILTDANLERCFEQEPLLSMAQRGALETQLEQLKEQLLQPVLNSIQSAAVVRELRRAANEAAALAWFTICPILVLPTLLEEKVRSTLTWCARQERIRPQRTAELTVGAAAC